MYLTVTSAALQHYAFQTALLHDCFEDSIGFLRLFVWRYLHTAFGTVEVAFSPDFRKINSKQFCCLHFPTLHFSLHRCRGKKLTEQCSSCLQNSQSTLVLLPPVHFCYCLLKSVPMPRVSPDLVVKKLWTSWGSPVFHVFTQ